MSSQDPSVVLAGVVDTLSRGLCKIVSVSLCLSDSGALWSLQVLDHVAP